ncbi:MAG: hypothetical protein L6Q81_17490 [Bacteroidia bacterium]|nr:hypothetical protein [Bacteroidia bacterium]
MKVGVLSICTVLLYLSTWAQPLSGIYTIGGVSPSFPTFNAAATALETFGVSGPVIFNVRNGTYTESVYLTAITGSSSTNTITFQSESGDSALVLLTYNGAANTFQWDSAQYVIMRKLSFRNTYISNQMSLAFVQRSHNITVENCFLQGLNGNTGYCLSFGDPDSCIYIKNNRIINCLDGISVYGNPNFPASDVVIENNYINSGDMGVALEDLASVSIRYNYTAGGFRGLYINGAGINELHHNTMRSGGGSALIIGSGYDPQNGRLRIENNLMIVTGSIQFYAVSLGSCDDLEFINNTIYFNTTNSNLSAFYANLIDSVFIYNNIFMDNGNGYVVRFGGNVWYKDFEHNVLFTNGTLFSPGISTPAQWQSTYQDYTSVFANPQFVNIPNDLHPTNPLVDGIAISGYGITDDLIGIPRHPQYPDPGCYEFSIIPVANLGADQTLCGDSLLLNAANNGSYYVWSTGDTTQTIEVTASGSYWVQVTNLAGVDRDTVNVTLNPVPTFALSANDSICAGDTTQLIATSNAITFSWLPVSGLNDPSAASVLASPTNSTTYTVTVTDANGCTATGNVQVTVITLPVASAGSDQSICIGNQVQIGSGSSFNCSWSPATGLSSASDCQPFASPASNETYILQVTDIYGCIGHDTIIITVNPLPTIALCCSLVLCPGDTVSLSASSSATKISWLPSTDLSSSSGSTVDAFPTTTTTIQVTATDSNGCMMSDSIVLTVYPAPPVPVISQSGLDLMSSETSGIQWYLNGNIINGETGQYHTPLQNGNYTVLYTDSNGCTATSAVYYFGSVNSPDVIQSSPTAYYGQQQGEIVIMGLMSENYRMNVYNSLGQIVFTDNVVSADPTATIRYPLNLNEGLYVISVEDMGETIVFRIAIASRSSVR